MIVPAKHKKFLGKEIDRPTAQHRQRARAPETARRRTALTAPAARPVISASPPLRPPKQPPLPNSQIPARATEPKGKNSEPRNQRLSRSRVISPCVPHCLMPTNPALQGCLFSSSLLLAPQAKTALKPDPKLPSIAGEAHENQGQTPFDQIPRGRAAGKQGQGPDRNALPRLPCRLLPSPSPRPNDRTRPSPVLLNPNRDNPHWDNNDEEVEIPNPHAGVGSAPAHLSRDAAPRPAPPSASLLSIVHAVSCASFM